VQTHTPRQPQSWLTFNVRQIEFVHSMNISRNVFIPFVCICVFLAVATPAIYASQTANKNQGRKKADEFVATAKALVGKTKEDVIREIGMPDSTSVAGGYESWKYRRLFGAYQRRKAIFGHISYTWQVTLEIVLHEGTVQNSTPSEATEVHRNSGDTIQ